MGDQTSERIRWVLVDFSSLKDDKYYSLPFNVAGYSWRLVAFPKGYMNGGHLCLYVELAGPASLPPLWNRRVNFTFTLVNMGLGKSNIVKGGDRFFNTTNYRSWGYGDFVSLTKIHDKNEGFLVNDQLVIVADLHVYPAPVAPHDLLGPRVLATPHDLFGKSSEQTVKICESLSRKEGNQASGSSLGESSSQIEQKTENTSKESLDDHDIFKQGSDDDDTSDESSDDYDDSSEESSDYDDTSEESSDGGTRYVRLARLGDTPVGQKNHKIVTNYMNELNNFLKTVFKLPQKLAKDDLSNAEATLAHMIRVTLKLETAKEKLANDPSKSDEAIENLPAWRVIGDCKCHRTVALEESEKDVNGFQVLPSQEESVRRIFEKHPDIALEFRGKNQRLKNACMTFLLSLIETLCQSLEELSTEDLVEADIALTYLKDAGFKVDWLEKKLDQVVEKKQKEESDLAKLKETEDILLELKQKCAELDALAEEQKTELSATRTPLSLDDVLF